MSAKAFRRWILRPAEGIFLFHPRAIERLRDPRRQSRRQPSAAIAYHLMGRRTFLAHLETENAEALSVIEGLALPDWVLLLPMPAPSVLRTAGERSLLRDYWARRFEGEVARAWQMAREDNHDLDRFGPAMLKTLIGSGGLAEARDVLTREGVAGAAEGECELCRAFVARVVRLRYFAPGTRGAFFPAVPDWPVVDRWLEESGLDLPPPLAGGRLPLALERGRPTMTCGAPAVRLVLPPDLPYGRSDPDRVAVASSASSPAVQGPTPAAESLPTPDPRQEPPPTPSSAPAEVAPTELQSRALSALRQGAAIRRRPGGLARLRDDLAAGGLTLLSRLSYLGTGISQGRHSQPRAGGLAAGLRLLGAASAAAQRAEWDSRFAAALGHIQAARSRYRHLAGTTDPEDPVERHLDQRQAAATESFASVLAVTWRLSGAATGDLEELIWRLSGEPGVAAPQAQSLLRNLEVVLLEGYATYYRIDLRGWLREGRPRQILPFQGTLKSLAALEACRGLLDGLPWPLADLDRFAAPLASLAGRIGERLEETVRPRLQEAIAATDLAPASPAGHLAAQRLTEAMAGLIRRRRHLKFADVRDLINRDALSLPDLRIAELWQGDRLGRFDRAAARALPGVYRRGEPYVKGLQRLSAPLFGTPAGRGLLRWALLPGIAAWAIMEVMGLLWGLALPGPGHPQLANPASVPLLGGLLSATANTGRGRASIRRLWRLLGRLLRVLFVSGPRRLLAWRPVAWLLGRRVVRRLFDRVLAPLLLGLVPLLPIAAIWLVAMPEGPGFAAWVAVLALAYTLGTLLRETPEGRHRLDDLASGWRRVWESLRHERLLDLMAPIMRFFEGAMRTLAEALHRIRTRLSPRLEEAPYKTLLKGLAAPLWAVWEAVLQFYAVVLIEPQLNPVKHFPAVTLGHKLMLPFLPVLTGGLHAALSAVLPAVVVLPLVAITVFLLPGLFGFLFWELKENWGLYGANRPRPVPQARLGPHGETLTGMLRRGFHSGTIPKAFDRLRQVLDRQLRAETPDPLALRRALAPLKQIEGILARFAEQELGAALRRGCTGETVVLAPVAIASSGIDLRTELTRPGRGAPVVLTLNLGLRGSELICTVHRTGPVEDLAPDCRQEIEDAIRWIADRTGATVSAPNPVPQHPRETGQAQALSAAPSPA